MRMLRPLGLALLIVFGLLAGASEAANTRKTLNGQTCTTTSVQLLAAHTSRIAFRVANLGSVTIYLGPTSSVSSAGALTTSGYPVAATTGTYESDARENYTGALWCITASGTADTRVEETFP